MTTKGKRYDKDFKLGAVKMVLEKGRSINSVAVDLGVSYDTLHRWIREFKTDPQNSFRGSGHLRPGRRRNPPAEKGKPGPAGGERHSKKGDGHLCKPPVLAVK